MAMTIGFVGLGAMGAPMSVNLQKAGHPVRGFDLRAEALAPLTAAGGTAAATAAEAAAGADLLILMVVNAAQARAVLVDGGALAAMPADGSVCLMATCPPSEATAIGDMVSESGRSFLDAPVSGGTKGAEAGSLTIMAAGPDEVFQRLSPVLDVLGGKVVHVGKVPGQGAAVKVVNQLLCGVHIAAAAEALTLASAMGLEKEAVLPIVGGSAAASWMLNDRGPRMLEDDPVVSSAVDIFVKDLGLVLSAGRDAKTGLPLSAAAHQMFLASSGAGDGLADDSQVIRAYGRLNGSRDD